MEDFGEEMKTVFAEAIVAETGIKQSLFFLRELLDFPGSILSIYLQYWFQGENMSISKDYLTPATRWQALIGTIPFLAFGILMMVGKLDHFQTLYFDLAFYLLALSGFLIGWIQGFPLWSYSYLGWSLVFAWWWSSMWVGGVYYGDRTLFILGAALVLGLVLTRSLKPVKKLFRDIWNDSTRLTLAMFAFAGFMGMIYDENHHPQLFWFMLASIFTISAGAWFFLRSSSLKGRILAILGGFAGAGIISWICDSTWDFHAYYGLTPTIRPWYQSLGITMAILTFWLGIVFWPIIIALIHHIANKISKSPSFFE